MRGWSITRRGWADRAERPGRGFRVSEASRVPAFAGLTWTVLVDVLQIDSSVSAPACSLVEVLWLPLRSPARASTPPRSADPAGWQSVRSNHPSEAREARVTPRRPREL